MGFDNSEDKVKTPTRIEYVRVENYRVLRQVEFPMRPLTLLLGPNGSGKSTLFDVFSFLSDCFRYGLQYAWDKRGKAREIRSRGSTGPVVIEIKYREKPELPLITYHLAIDEEKKGPVVVEEWLQWQRDRQERPLRFLEYHCGEVRVIGGELPDRTDQEVKTSLRSPSLIASNTMGQFANYPRVAALREFILGWRFFGSPMDTREQLEKVLQERATLSEDGLPNTIRSLQPASDDNVIMRAYLTILCARNCPSFIGIEEPERFLCPHSLSKLSKEFRTASRFTQILISTHSPTFVNSFRPEEVLILSRDQQGYTQITLAANIRGVREFLNAGAGLGDLWLEGYLTNS